MRRIDVLWDGDATALAPSCAPEERLGNGLRRLRLKLDESVRIVRRRRQHSLELRFHTEAGESEHWSFPVAVRADGKPVIHVESLETVPVPGKPQSYTLELRGWVENSGSVSHLSLEIDGYPVTAFGMEHSRPDIAEALGGGLVTRQGFRIEAPVNGQPAAAIPVRLITGQRSGPPVTWEGVLTLPQPPVLGFLIESEDLARLQQKDPVFWSSLTIRGRIISSLPDLRATLYVDGRSVEERAVVPDGTFVVRYEPAESGHARVRLTIDSRRRPLFDSGQIEVFLRRIAVPRRAVETVSRLLARFSLSGVIDEESPTALVRRLLERDLESVSGFSQMLRAVEQTLERSGGELPAANAVSPRPRGGYPRYAGPPLRVLFAAWEVPSLRHGGGVCMTNLLKGLGRRHHITLVHPYYPEEEGWVEDVRPWVDRIISVPRRRERRIFRGDPQVPYAYFYNYLPELRRALEAEVLAGGYDLVNYEYAMMYAHLLPAVVPQVLTILELSYAAQLTEYSEKIETIEEAAAQLSAFIKAFYFHTTVLPAACSHLITLTEEDARALAQFSVRAEIYVNTIGVDNERFSPPVQGTDRLRGSTAPTLVYLGNYQHSPNVHAASYFGRKIVPLVRRRCPEARYLVIGSHPPAELWELDREDDITVTGLVGDFRPYLWRATAFVAPIFVGAGMRVKLLEAMACGCPIIATRLAMHGLGATPGEHYLRAESAEDFTAWACRAIEDPDLAAAVGRAGRRMAEEKHGLEVKAAEGEAIWGRVLAASGDGKGRGPLTPPKPKR